MLVLSITMKSWWLKKHLHRNSAQENFVALVLCHDCWRLVNRQSLNEHYLMDWVYAALQNPHLVKDRLGRRRVFFVQDMTVFARQAGRTSWRLIHRTAAQVRSLSVKKAGYYVGTTDLFLSDRGVPVIGMPCFSSTRHGHRLD